MEDIKKRYVSTAREFCENVRIRNTWQTQRIKKEIRAKKKQQIKYVNNRTTEKYKYYKEAKNTIRVTEKRNPEP